MPSMPAGPGGSIGTGMAGISGISGSIVMGGSMQSMMPPGGVGMPGGGISGPGGQGGSSTYLRMRNGSNQMPESNSKRREIGDLAVWTLSSAKQGNGVDQLRDNQISTFWQSDGQQPHYINIQFLKKIKLSEICMYLDFKTDESYTPQKISIRLQNSF